MLAIWCHICWANWRIVSKFLLLLVTMKWLLGKLGSRWALFLKSSRLMCFTWGDWTFHFATEFAFNVWKMEKVAPPFRTGTYSHMLCKWYRLMWTNRFWIKFNNRFSSMFFAWFHDSLKNVHAIKGQLRWYIMGDYGNVYVWKFSIDVQLQI